MAEKTTFTLIRDIAVPVDVVWRAWTDPALMVKWMHPRGISTSPGSVTSNPVEGGRYTYTMVDSTTGTEYPTGGAYVEVIRPRRLVFSWGEPEDAVENAPRLALELEPNSTGTQLTLTCSLPADPGGEIRDGWVEALDYLDATARSVVR